MSEEKSIGTALVEGIFGLLKQWWFWLIVIVGGGLLWGQLDPDMLSSFADKAVQIIKAVKGG
jgi:hypothetical protein